MAQTTYKDLLDAGAHFGHLTRKWDPKMAPYIFMEKNGIHIIDLNKTLVSLDYAATAIRNIAKSGRKIMFVATKKQAQEIVTTEAERLKMPFVTDRWLGGMLTNFATVRKSLKKMATIDKMVKENTAYAALAKREKLMMSRERAKLDRVLGGIADLDEGHRLLAKAKGAQRLIAHVALCGLHQRVEKCGCFAHCLLHRRVAAVALFDPENHLALGVAPGALGRAVFLNPAAAHAGLSAWEGLLHVGQWHNSARVAGRQLGFRRRLSDGGTECTGQHQPGDLQALVCHGHDWTPEGESI